MALRFRARLVSASHPTAFRFALNGNAPTDAASTIRALLSLSSTWKQSLMANNDHLVILVRDVTKAYVQSKRTGRLVYYKPPPEYFEVFPDKISHIWKAEVQLYGDVEAGKYWHQTFVPWLLNNILDYQQALCDPLLYSPTVYAATALFTGDEITLIPASFRYEEAKIGTRFKCREALMG